jgi:hypothetical protein
MSNIKDANLLFLMKSHAWEREQEWRFIRLLEKADIVKPGRDGMPIHLFRFPLESLQEVVVGCRADEDLTAEIGRVLENNPALAHVILYQAIEKPNEFGLEIEERGI